MTYKMLLIPADTNKRLEVLDLEEADLLAHVFGGAGVAPDEQALGISSIRSQGVQFAYDDLGLIRIPRAPKNVRAMRIWATLIGVDPHDFATPLVGNFVMLGLRDDGETMNVRQEILELAVSLR